MKTTMTTDKNNSLFLPRTTVRGCKDAARLRGDIKKLFLQVVLVVSQRQGAQP